jgi:hypothetical protein
VVVNNSLLVKRKLERLNFLNQLPIWEIFTEHKLLLEKITVKHKLIQEQFVSPIMFHLLKNNMLVQDLGRGVMELPVKVDFNKMPQMIIYWQELEMLMTSVLQIILKRYLKDVLWRHQQTKLVLVQVI